MKIAAHFFLLVLVSSITSCTTDNDEARLRQSLASLVEAVEDRSVRQVQKYLTDDFKTARYANTQQVKAFMLLHFRQNKVINVFTSDIQTSIQEEKADVIFNVLVTGSSNWLPERGRRFEVKSRWLKQDDDWKISRINWQEKVGIN
jgi:hypothetical protein